MLRWLVMLAIGLGLVRLAWADDDTSKSTPPGDLTSSHASLDNASKCNDCHEGRKVTREKCLGCHEHQDLGARIAAGKGFHASNLVRGKACEGCHKEHAGRAADPLGWNTVRGGQKGFDHDLSGWPLRGKHQSTACDACHKTKNSVGVRTYMGTERLCGASGCHGNDQPHKLERRELLVCERCHTENVWLPEKKPMDFNHDDRKDAGMPILGSHVGVPCKKCHQKDVFNLPGANPNNCSSNGCHKTGHAGHLFDTKPCDWCHSPTFRDFKQRDAKSFGKFFDHDERTRFDLGAHEKLACYSCHKPQLGDQKPQAACEQCHAKDNKHGQRFSKFGAPQPRCATCHPTTSWKQNRFDHKAATGFPLQFKHAAIACRACHRGRGPADFEKFTFKGTECKSCHQHRTVHSDDDHPQGRYTNQQCTKCHRPGDVIVGNNASIVAEYHGPTSAFPLVKAHKSVPCAQCHVSRSKNGKATFESESPQCGDRCHEDSLHKGELGKKCLPCHSSGTWDALRFDHSVDKFPDGTAGFPLLGEHQSVKCESCHGKNRRFTDAPRACSAAGCHADDDAHKGHLGNKCERCHLETGDNKFDHNRMSRFRIDGKHKEVRCADCHPSITFRPRPTSCFGCHPEPPVHRGQYGTYCEQCHTTATWIDVKPLHDVGDFALKGAHGNIACERCHRDNRPLAGSGNLCINCHRQDDIHNNSLSPRCGECHTQWSFAPAKFDHSRVGCNLTGLHRTIACFDCHKNGNFSGVSPQCASCHRDDALKAGGAGGIDHAGQTSCTGCHNPNIWKPAAVGGASAFGRESVCR